MGVDPLAVATFTILPLLALLGGLLFSIWYAFTTDRRLAVAAALFAMMTSHQLTEAWLLVTGPNPLGNLPGEVFETSVNLLAVATVLLLVRRLETERRRRERQAVLTRELSNSLHKGPGEEPTTETGERGLFRPALFGLPVIGRLVAWAYTTLPLGTTAQLSPVIETAVRNVQVTFPATTVDRGGVPDMTVFAEATTLEDIVETVLKQFVVYNDSSEPTIQIDVTVKSSTVRIQIHDNGPGLPDTVADQLQGRAGKSTKPDLELAPVHGLLEKWGGSVRVDGGTLELMLLSPRPGRAEDRPIGGRHNQNHLD